jgi:hypothetical protein
MNKGVGQHDVERILRDVLSTYGVNTSELRVEQTPSGWRVVVTNPGRTLSTDLANDRPAGVRAALTNWVLNQH